MALRNAFDNLGTEQALRRIANLLTFARDSSDRVKVAVEIMPTTNIRLNTVTGNQGASVNAQATPGWYDLYSASVVEPREIQRLTMRGLSDNVRKNRWTY